MVTAKTQNNSSVLQSEELVDTKKGKVVIDYKPYIDYKPESTN